MTAKINNPIEIKRNVAEVLSDSIFLNVTIIYTLTKIKHNTPIVVMHTENPKYCNRKPPNDGPVISLKRLIKYKKKKR